MLKNQSLDNLFLCVHFFERRCVIDYEICLLLGITSIVLLQKPQF